MNNFDRIFPTDILSKRERIERTLRHETVDRVALHEQLSHSPGVISLYTGRMINGFDYKKEDIGIVVRKTLDICFPMVDPFGTGRMVDEDGMEWQNDNWTVWHLSRPFCDEDGARRWLAAKTERIRKNEIDPSAERAKYREEMQGLQSMIGDTVIMNYSTTGMCDVFDRMGLEIFTYFYYDHPDEMLEYMETYTDREEARIDAVADTDLSPVILIAEDFATKQGPIFGPEFLESVHYPYVKKITDAWHRHGMSVIYHSDGNYKKAIPDLIKCGVDGFYCLEPACGMDIVELKNTWPQMVWSGGVDGVELMESGYPEDVRKEVRRHILETDALNKGGMIVSTSSNINPTVRPENYKAMVDAVGELNNRCFFEGH